MCINTCLVNKQPIQQVVTALTTARDAGQGDDMVSQMVDFYVKRFKG